MSRPILDRQVVIDVSRWHWTLTIPLLATWQGTHGSLPLLWGFVPQRAASFGIAFDRLGCADVPLTHGIGDA